jgi:hypothetical protein
VADFMVSDGTNFSEFVPSKADGVVDYNNPNNVIKLGWSGASFTATDFTYALGLSNDKKIKDVSKTEYKKWLGLNDVNNTADASKSVKYAASAGNASSASYATKAGSADNEYCVMVQSAQPTDSRCKLWIKI